MIKKTEESIHCGFFHPFSTFPAEHPGKLWHKQRVIDIFFKLVEASVMT
jgi:hypothetical protein